eukprot:scaffold579_cov546-Prasinococcus_capsulatus_cf.AAC.9
MLPREVPFKVGFHRAPSLGSPPHRLARPLEPSPQPAVATARCCADSARRRCAAARRIRVEAVRAAAPNSAGRRATPDRGDGGGQTYKIASGSTLLGYSVLLA